MKEDNISLHQNMLVPIISKPNLLIFPGIAVTLRIHDIELAETHVFTTGTELIILPKLDLGSYNLLDADDNEVKWQFYRYGTLARIESVTESSSNEFIINFCGLKKVKIFELTTTPSVSGNITAFATTFASFESILPEKSAHDEMLIENLKDLRRFVAKLLQRQNSLRGDGRINELLAQLPRTDIPAWQKAPVARELIYRLAVFALKDLIPVDELQFLFQASYIINEIEVANSILRDILKDYSLSIIKTLHREAMGKSELKVLRNKTKDDGENDKD